MKRSAGILFLTVTLSMFGCSVRNASNNPPDKQCGNSSNGYFSIYYPASGQSIKIGTIDSIKWASLASQSPAFVTLSLYNGEKIVSILRSNTSNSGIYKMTLPSVGTGDKYRIKINSSTDSSINDYSCYFNLYSDYYGAFSISNPAAGRTYSMGDTTSIRWSSSGSPGTRVVLHLCIDSTPISTIDNQATNDLIYEWMVPTGLSTLKNYRIKIVSYYDPGIFAFSDTFSISGIALDPYEPDNDRKSASTLSILGKEQKHTIAVGDTDWVKFTADSGSIYVIQLMGNLMLRGYLYYDTGTSFANYFTGGTTVSGSLSQWLCTKSGIYYAKLSSYSSYTGNYTFNVTLYDSISMVTFIAPTSKASWEVGSYYSIQWIPDTVVLGTAVSLYLFKGAQQVYYIASAASNSGTYSFFVPTGLATSSEYRIKIANYSSSVMTGFSDLFSIAGLAPDAYEPDDNRQSASTLDSLGKAQAHNLTLNDTDWVQFTADSGSIYLLQTYGTVATRVYLFCGNEVTFSNSFSTSSTSNPLQWPCLRSGIWYARISSYTSGSAGGTYSFKMSWYDSLSTVAFSNPVATSIWAAGTSYQIKWSPDTALLGAYVNFYLYKGTQQLMTITTSVSNGGTCTWSVPSGLATGSDYRIRIANYSETTMGGFSDQFTISGVQPDAYEPDGARELASNVDSLGKSPGHTFTLSDTDWVKFKADSGIVYILQTYGTLATRVYIYYGNDASYNTYFYDGSASPSKQWTCIKSGTWYARIYPYSSGTSGVGTYSFNVSKFDSLAMVTFSSPLANAVWAAGTSYQIKWIPDSSVLGSYVYIYLYKGSQQLYVISSSASNSGIYSFTIPSGLATGDDYRIRIANYSTTLIGGFSPAFTISGIMPDAYEPDNNRESASTMDPLGKSQVHNLTTNDTDWVKFTADSGVYILQSIGTVSVRVYLFFGSETSYSNSFSSSSTTLSSQWICTRKGVWFARVYPYSSGSSNVGNYSFTISRFDSLSMVSFSSPLATSIWNTGTSYRIQWAPDTGILGTSVYMYLYKGNRQLQYVYSSSRSNNGYYDWTVPLGLATGTDYRIKIVNYSNTLFGGFSPSFTISGILPDTFETDDSASQAKVIATDGSEQMHSLSVGDVDWFSFTAQKDSTYIISVYRDTATLSTTYAYLYASPTASSSITYTYSANPKIVWACTQSSTYYLKVYPYSTSYYGKYRVSIRKYSSQNSVVFANPTTTTAWSAGSSYSIQWASDTSLLGQYVNLQLYADTAYLRSIATSVSNTGMYSWTVTSGLATGSNYKIKLSSYDNTQIFGFSPAFSISGIDPDAYEPDDSVSRAHTIATTGTPENHSLSLNDKDWFAFSAAAKYVYSIKTTGATRTTSTQLSLYSTDGATVITSASSTTADSSATIIMYCATAGTYFFRATGSIGAFYTAMVSGNDSSKYSLIVSSPGAGDSLAIGQIDTISWSSQVNVGGYVDIYLYNSVSVVQTIAADVANSGTYRWTIASTITPANDYYVKVMSRINSNINGNSGVFTIKGN